MSSPRIAAAAVWLLAAAATSAQTFDAESLLVAKGCTNCHAAPEALAQRTPPWSAPRLARVGSRVTSTFLELLLRDPARAQPEHRMPDLLHGMEPAEREETIRALTAFLGAAGGPLAPSAASAPHPVALEGGRELYHTVGCVACHAPVDRPWHLEVPWHEKDDWIFDRDADAPPLPADSAPFPDLAAKTTVEELARFLEDPLEARPSGRMPSLGLDGDEALAIAKYLLRDQAFGEAREPVASAGIAFEYFEGHFEDPPAFGEVIERGAVDALVLPDVHRDDDFGYRFTAEVEIKTAGTWTFYTTSDDGSRLYVNGELVVNNDGPHGMDEASGTIELEAGVHALEVTHYEHGGGEGLIAEWEGPGVPRGVITGPGVVHRAWPFAGFETESVLDPDLVALGAARFGELGCAQCHDDLGHRIPTEYAGAPALEDLDGGAAGSCLSDEPRAGLPRFEWEDAERIAIRELLAQHPTEARSIEDSLAATLASFRCVACHERGGVGGPQPGRREYFHVLDDVELGDQGRIPPTLDLAGAKLREGWMHAVLFEGEIARPYMATRMPQFGESNIGHVPDLLRELDADTFQSAEPEFELADLEAGRQLLGTDGLGCIQCHEFAGYDSLGVPAVDLADMHERLRWGWFRELLLDPGALNMNTRMPTMWVDGLSPVKDVHGGDVEQQIATMWGYLSQGWSMPVPEGVAVEDAAFELVPTDRPLSVTVFMEDVSPRTLVVGFPEHMHYAYDLEGGGLALLWKGRFFNARGTWEGRAGELEWPPAETVVELFSSSPGVVLDIGAGGDEAHPDDPPRLLGRTFDAQGNPTFRHAVWGGRLEESIAPARLEDELWMVRTWSRTQTFSQRSARYWAPLAKGAEIEDLGAGEFLIDGYLRVAILDRALSASIEELDEEQVLSLSSNLHDLPESWSVAYQW